MVASEDLVKPHPDTHCLGGSKDGKCLWCGAELADRQTCMQPLAEPRKVVYLGVRVGEIKISRVDWTCHCGYETGMRADQRPDAVRKVLEDQEIFSLCRGCGAKQVVRKQLIETRQTRRRKARSLVK